MSAQQHKPGAPVVGFNHNLNYKGRVFHVQTEDSGPQHGHTITHIFMGGNILASTRSSYTELLLTIDPGDLFSAVRKLMEDQHKAMMKSLLQGGHDAEILRRTGGTVYEPGVLAGGERAPSLLVGGDRSPTSVPPPVARATSIPPTPPPMPSSLASSLPKTSAIRPLATGVAPSPPVMVPKAISMETPTPPTRANVASAPRAPAPRVPGKEAGSAPVAQTSRGWDEVILSYLASDADGAKR
jgi:hypothetical protein